MTRRSEILYTFQREGKADVVIYRDHLGLLTIAQTPSYIAAVKTVPKFDSWEEMKEFLSNALSYVEEVLEVVKSKNYESGLSFVISR